MAKANAKKYYDLVDRIWKDGVGGKEAANIKANDLAKGESSVGSRAVKGHRVTVHGWWKISRAEGHRWRLGGQ